jgi:hypothetical protein
MPFCHVYVTNGGVLLSIQNKLPLVTAGVHEGKNEINARLPILLSWHLSEPPT